MKISKNIREHVDKVYGKYYESLSGVKSEKIVSDVLSETKPIEQIGIIERYYGPIKGKKLLEVGSGFGIFVCVARSLGIEAFGIEPNSDGFMDSFELSKKILEENGLDSSIIKSGFGEKIPFEDNSFDIVYSTNVLEHCLDPKAFISESIRVCNKKGMVQIVVPSYGSFYDGHYSSFYIPYQPNFLWKLYIKYLYRRDISYIDTLRTEINYFSVYKLLTPYIKNKEIQILNMGEEVFIDRMKSLEFSAWAGLEKVKRLLILIKKMRLIKLATKFMLFTKSYNPIIITLVKN